MLEWFSWTDIKLWISPQKNSAHRSRIILRGPSFQSTGEVGQFKQSRKECKWPMTFSHAAGILRVTVTPIVQAINNSMLMFNIKK